MIDRKKDIKNLILRETAIYCEISYIDERKMKAWIKCMY